MAAGRERLAHDGFVPRARYEAGGILAIHLAIGLVAHDEAVFGVEDDEAFGDAFDRVAQQRVGAHRALARFDQLGLVADRAAITDEAAVIGEDRLAADADMEAAARQLQGDAELAEGLMCVEDGFVLAP